MRPNIKKIGEIIRSLEEVIEKIKKEPIGTEKSINLRSQFFYLQKELGRELT